MLEKLKIIYARAEDLGGGFVLVEQDGKQGLFKDQKRFLPLEYHQIRLMESFIVAGVSGGYGYATIFNRQGRRVVPRPEAPKARVEIHAVHPWPNTGLVLLMKEPPSYKNPMKLVLLGNGGAYKEYEQVTRQPLMVENTSLAAIVKPGEKPQVSGFSIPLARCIAELENGTLAEVIDRDFTPCPLPRLKEIKAGNLL